MPKILADQVNLGFIDSVRELVWCCKLQEASNEETETLKKENFLQQQQKQILDNYKEAQPTN